MSAVDQLFQDLRASGRKAFMPFVTSGDPDMEMTLELIRKLSSLGVDLIEVGLAVSPYCYGIAVVGRPVVRPICGLARISG